ncbi:hypothetical protein FB45DRAFT_928310 [Roridomyces roridus]|uniref:3-beta hydroxysteroid dehydrogenase/isomerase domain-containing protein n=1 Tax=Roridomyces roridus TaxID=1738132 RepID=A0AAD7FHX3_9AGAR|nr:hypothetical protein FB45DRAFT_928310 [Roridomyces roridus]
MLLPQLGIPILLLYYLFRVARRLRSSSASAASRSGAQNVNELDLDAVSYKDIDMLKAIPPVTHAGYAIIGGSGFLGTYIVRLLLMRGETSIRILDMNPPGQALEHPSVSFVKCDISSLQSIRDALVAPFPATGSPPNVIFHTAAIIRFWERAAYCWDASYRINVLGTQNILTVAKELPDAIVVYTSSGEVVSGAPKFMRVDWDAFPVCVKDEDHPPKYLLKQSCYPRSKRMAEQLVMEASASGLKTGILRPGHTIIGPNDRMTSSTLLMPQLPLWDQPWTSTDVCVWDVAAAHLLYEDALRRIPEEVSGQGFLITGRGHYATRELVFVRLPPLLVYLLAHLMEGFLWCRYHLLTLVSGTRPALIPSWLGSAVFLQPATLDGQLIDLIIDDSRARKVLGYRPLWDMAQSIRYSVDEIQSGSVPATHGLKVY